jgi:hypothetical protein
VPYNTHACQLKNENPQSHSQLRVSRQKLGSAPEQVRVSKNMVIEFGLMMVGRVQNAQ